MKTKQALVEDLKKLIPEVSTQDVEQIVKQKNNVILLDVRETDEVSAGHLPNALHISRGFLELQIESKLPERETQIITYCAGGVRSLFAAESLQKMGYKNVRSMSGGYQKWAKEGRATEKAMILSDEEKRRYSRHITIPEVGTKGQKLLIQSKVLMIGAGGLGCPAAIYLAAAGVGTLGIVDFDKVDESNLQRQILHTTDRVGTPKTESAKKTILALNPLVKVKTFETQINSKNVEEIVKDFDLVIDGSDNFATRYLINDACILLKKPCVHGSVYRFEGQVTVFAPYAGGPCYRCLYPEPPPAGMAPSCAEAGVLGVLPGVIGLLEAIEAIKWIIGAGNPLVGRLLTYDALEAKFRELKLRKDPDCVYCGEGKSFPGFIDYEVFCSAHEGQS
ncbi:MAG: molybdopterin-synthase adenylyltransferase MoeB [Planctomycetota bacterium]